MTLPSDPEQWEAICQRCGVCCLTKHLSKNGEVVYTNIACFLLDVNTRQCRSYLLRRRILPSCKTLSRVFIPDWLPHICAYRRLKDGKPFATQDEIDQYFPWEKVVSEIHVKPPVCLETHFLCFNHP